jgi:PAS domain S-box-containing protein
MSVADPRERIRIISLFRFHTRIERYGFALLAVTVATALTFGLRHVALSHAPFTLFYPAVVLVAMWCGRGPGLLATALAATSSGYFFLEPTNSFRVRTPEDVTAPALFALIGVLLTFLMHSRSKARQALRVSEDELNRAQVVARIGSWHYDIDRADLRLSDEACRILELPLQTDVSLRQAWEIVHPDDRERVNDSWTVGLNRGEYDDESRVLVAGQTRWVRVQASIERFTDGRASKAVGTIQDITERKRAEEALLESEDRYRDLVENSKDLCCTHDLDGRLLSVNAGPARILGYTPEEMLKIPMRDLIIPEGRAEFDAYLDRLRKGSKVEVGLLCVITRSGEWRTWEYCNTLRTEGVPTPIVRGMAHDITDQRRAELALQESEERLRLAQEIAHIGTFDRNLLTGESTWTPQMEAMYGLKRGTFPRTISGFLELVHRDDREHVTDLVKRSIEQGEAQGEWRVQWLDGSVRWITGRWKVFKDSEGRPVRAIGIDYDITERKHAEEALRNSEQRYRLLFEKNLAGVAVSSLTGRLLDCNEAWAQMLGYESADEIRGRPTREFYFNPAEREPLVGQLKQHGAFTGGEVRLRRKDGSAVWVLFDCVVHRPEAGDPTVQSTVIDITERRKADEMLRANEERFRVALRGSPTAVFSQDRELRYTWIYNFARLVPDQVLGKTDDQILGPDKARRMRELKQRVLKTGKGIREEISITHNGSSFAYDLTIEPLFDTEGNVVGITGAAMDIARLREMADRLAEQRDKLAQEKSYLEGEIETELGFEQIVGQSPALREVLKKVRIVAPTDSTVLLLGETGTGKELVARALHALSSRHEKSFIKLNCAAVPSGLLESELFGHEKGAFTGAVNQKLGRLELADGGTLFLDEVGELPLELQPKLLRVLQDREFERLGGVRTLHVDVRIISATNCDLHRAVVEKNFREDLFYRLNVFPISLPPLRDRRSDIPALVSHFVKKYSNRMGRSIEVVPADTMRVLQDWNWPGNVRELENMIERMVILSKENVLAPPPVELRLPQENTEDNLVEMERDHIVGILRETHGVLAGVEGAANRLGIKRTTLQSLLKRLGIDPGEYRRGTGTFGRD